MKFFEGVIFECLLTSECFVELENTIEGLVRMASMDDDYYIFDDKHYCLIGERTKKRYPIGDKIRVRLAKADIQARQIEFVLEESSDRGNKGIKKPRPMVNESRISNNTVSKNKKSKRDKKRSKSR